MTTSPRQYPISLARLEKEFGPYIGGIGDETNTISAVEQVLRGKAKGSYIGVPGICPDAAFHIQFPQPFSLSDLKVRRKGVAHDADCVSGLEADGPQSEQGRKAHFDQWKVRKEWNRHLQELDGDYAAEMTIPELGMDFAVTIRFSGKKIKKASIRGKLEPK